MAIVQKSVGLHPEDWEEIEVISRVYHTSQSGFIRMLIDFWRENRDPKDPRVQRELEKLATKETEIILS